MLERAPRWAQIALLIPALTVIIVGIAFMIPGGKSGDGKAAPAEVQPNGESVTVTLRGPEEWVSTGVNLNQLPGGLHYSFGGPTDTKVRFVDEGGNVLAEGHITDSFGVQGGIPEFAGTDGETATLQVAS